MKFQIKPTNIVSHSAKGTQWENHKYIKVEDGKYYYPDSYASGRHLGDNNQDQQQETVDSREPAGWENKLYSNFESGLKDASGKLDLKAVQQMLLFGKDDSGKGYDNFAIALSKAGIDASKIDPKSLNLMRHKVVEHYKQEFEKEKKNFDQEGNRTKDRTKEQEEKIHGKAKSSSSKKKSSSKAKVETQQVATPAQTPTISTQRKKRKVVTNRSGKTYTPGQVRHSIFPTMPYIVEKTEKKILLNHCIY